MANKYLILKCLFLAILLFGFVAPIYASPSAQEYFEQGNKLYNQKKYSEAVASYIHAIQTQPKSHPMAYLNCARAYSMQKNYAAAVQYYTFYSEVEPASSTDKKFKAEFKAAQQSARKATYQRDNAQTTVLRQLEGVISSDGPWYSSQGNGGLAYYDVLVRAGFAEPKLAQLQQAIVTGLSKEIEKDIKPPSGQPNAGLDRTGWEFIRTKLEKTRQFVDAPPDENRLVAIEATAKGWEAFYRGAYDESKSYFDTACQASPAIPAAHWGRLMLEFQTENSTNLAAHVDETENIYRQQGIDGVDHYFTLLRAQIYRNAGDVERSMAEIAKLHGSLK